MHRLVPKFILDQMADNQVSGEFHAISLFVDVSGFTPLATALMEYSTEGAEVIADMLRASFEPLIDIIYAHNGFVATFAGDAFTALFPTSLPTELSHTQNIYHQAITAAWQCHNFVKDNANQMTRFGEFVFAIKISIADGMVDWKIWQSAHVPGANNWQQRAAYSFTGEALDYCFAADATALAGSIVLTPTVYQSLPPDALCGEWVETYFHLKELNPALVDQVPSHNHLPQPSIPALVEQFFPPALWQRAATGEFRQIVSVFINLATFPQGQSWVAFQNCLFEQIAQYGGYLCSIGRTGYYDRTCTILLFWGMPASYENNVTRALRFVLALRQSSPVSMRVGITYHLAYAGFIGGAHRAEYTCYGVHVTLAARQMTSAPWGEIVLDEATAVQAYKDFHLLAAGNRRYKGFIDPRPIYLLDNQYEHVTETYDRVPLIGREREIAELHTFVQPLFAGHFGGLVLVMGESGMGKSRLLREFRRLITTAPTVSNPVPNPVSNPVPNPVSSTLRQSNLAEEPFAEGASNPEAGRTLPVPTWYYCRSDEILRRPLHPFRYFLRRYCNQLIEQDPQSNRQQFVEKFDGLLAATADPTLAGALKRIRPVLAELIELPWEDPFYQQLEPALRLENVLEALITLLKAESCRHPLIIHLEDGQWLDAESRLFLKRLIRNLDGYPLLLLMTTRAGDIFGITAAETDIVTQFTDIPHQVLQLQPLSQYSLRMLATALLTSPLTQSTLGRLYERAKGNPFFAEQMLLYWQEQDLLRWGDQGWQFEESLITSFEGNSSLSPDIRTLLTARLDKLPIALRMVVQAASILGSEFDHAVLAHILQQQGLPSDCISAIEQEGIWHLVGPTIYHFHHALLRDAAYGMQSRTQVKQMHLRAAAAIKAIHQRDVRPYYATLSYHYHEGNDQEQECYYAKSAGRYAAENYLNEEAVRFFDRALALTADDALTEHYELYTQRGAVYQWLGDRHKEYQDIQQQWRIAQTLGNQQWQAETLLREANYERITGNYDVAIDHCQRAITLATCLDNLSLQGDVCFMWGRVLRHQGRYQEAQVQLQRALNAADRVDEPSLEANALYEIGHLYYVQGSYEQAALYYRRAEVIYQRIDDKKGQIHCLLVFGAIAYGRGIFAEAEDIYQKALTITRTLGWKPGETSCLSSLGNTYFDIGDFTTAHAYHAQALAIWQESGDREGEAASLDTLGLIAHHQGDLDGALHYYHGALTIQQELSDQRGEAYTQTHLGYTALAKEEFSQAGDCFQRALAIRQKLGEERAAIDSLAGLALVQWQVGELSAATATIRTIVEQLERKGIDGLEFPVQVYLICHEILDAAAADQAQDRTLAETILRAGHQLIQKRAALINDLKLRRLFLERIPANARIVSLWQRHQPGNDTR